MAMRANDGGRLECRERTMTIATTSAAPTVAMTPRRWRENDGPVALDGGIAVSDADSPTLTGATVAMTTNFRGGEDLLAFTSQNGIAGSFDAGAGVLTLTGSASVASYQAALRSIAYHNTSEDPATISRTVSVTVTDGAHVERRDLNDHGRRCQRSADADAAGDVTVDEFGPAHVALSIGTGAAAECRLVAHCRIERRYAAAHPAVDYTSARLGGLCRSRQRPCVRRLRSRRRLRRRHRERRDRADVHVIVRPINDPPTLSPLDDRSVVAGAGAQTVALSDRHRRGQRVATLAVTACRATR
jgi:hypothetical protein